MRVSYLIMLWLIAVFNRGGAAIGIGQFGITQILLIQSILLYFTGASGRLKRSDLWILTPIGVLILIALLHLATDGVTSNNLLNSSPLLYPIATLGGLHFSRRQSQIPDTFFWWLFASVAVVGVSAPLLRSTLYGVISFNGYSLFGYYGSYYTVVIPAFCYFFTRKQNFRAISLLVISAAAVMVLGSRSGMIALAICLLTFAFTRRKTRYIFSVSVLAAVLTFSLVFLFPILNSFSAGFRGDFSFSYYWYAIMSILVPDAGMDTYGTTLIGSRTHRLEMAEEVAEAVFHSPDSSLIGIGVAHDLVSTSFRNPHNGYMTILGRSGLIGLTALVALLFIALLNCAKLTKPHMQSDINLGKEFGLAFVVSSIWMIGFTTMLDSPMNAIPFFFFLGFVMGESSQTRKRIFNTSRLQVERNFEINK